MSKALKYLVDKYKIDLKQPGPFRIPMGRGRDVPFMFRRLGFKVGAEVGVYQGNYSKDILHRVPGLKLYAIDVWDNYDGYIDFSMFDKNHMKESYEKAKENVRGYDCELIKATSREAAKQFKDESLDFVFIDANHAYEDAVEDIALWSKKVKKGGVIYGHDYHDFSKGSRWKTMNVINAVDGWVKSYRIHPLFILDKNKYACWMYIK